MLSAANLMRISLLFLALYVSEKKYREYFRSLTEAIVSKPPMIIHKNEYILILILEIDA